MVVGSLIAKNPGGGLAPCGGYIAGRKDCIERRLLTGFHWDLERKSVATY